MKCAVSVEYSSMEHVQHANILAMTAPWVILCQILTCALLTPSSHWKMWTFISYALFSDLDPAGILQRLMSHVSTKWVSSIMLFMPDTNIAIEFEWKDGESGQQLPPQQQRPPE